MKSALTATLAALTITCGAVWEGQAAEKKHPPKASAFVCTMEYAPVCGTMNKKRVTFGNACMAKHAGATRVRKGACEK